MARSLAQKPTATSTKKGQGASATGYWFGSPTVHKLRFPIAFIPKYRKRVLEGAVAQRIEELFREGCEVMGKRSCTSYRYKRIMLTCCCRFPQETVWRGVCTG